MNRNKIKIAITDDHQIVIDGLKSLLQDHPVFEVVLECTQPLQLLSLLEQQPVHLLLTDVMMPGINGDELAKKVRASYPDIRILALSMSGQGELVNRMIADADIAGYVLKNIGKTELLQALEKIAAGGVFFSDEVLAEMHKTAEINRKNEEAHLTRREIEIIQLIEKEYSNKAIADTLFLSERTVETHRKNIFRKTQTSGVLGLIKYAYEHKLI
jgi:two-component system, NarL family, nitrate/nitrite response regulator NarL